MRQLLALLVVCATIAAAPRLWPGNPLVRWNPEVANNAAVVALVLGVLLPLYWVGDRIWAVIEAREDSRRPES